MARWLILGVVGALLVVVVALSALASDSPSLATTCESGIVVDRIPGADADPEGVPVVVDAALSKELYGESVNVLDGVSEEELPVVREVASRLKFCWVEDAEGDHWQVFMPQ